MSKRKGFTILELLVVVAIIAIIAVIAIPNFIGAVDKAKDARDLAEIASMQDATTLYYMTEGHYPTAQQPTDGSPQSVILSALIPDYLSKQPNYPDWQVDYSGKVSHGIGTGGESVIASGDPATMLNEAQWARFDWSSVKAPAGQASGNIGVDSWGNPVNMDLWAAHKLKPSDNSVIGGYTTVGTIALNISDGIPPGYLGAIVGGKIEGYVPARVKLAGDSQFVAVTSLDGTFYNISGLVTAPIVPNSVRSMRVSYTSCPDLVNVPALPNGLLNLDSTFLGCISLQTAPTIPNGVRNLQSTFADCFNLVAPPPLIPEGVVQLSDAFVNCANLATMPTLPAGTNPNMLFLGCTKLGY